MAHLAYLILFASAIIAYVVSQIIYNLFFNPLKHFPGPKLWACTGIPWSVTMLKGDMTKKLAELHEKYGEIVRVAPKEISVSSPSGVRDVLAHRQGHEEFSKLLKIRAFNGLLGILTAHRNDHARYRRVLSNSFSDRSIRSQEPVLQKYSTLLVNGLAQHESEGPQDMVQWFNWTTFDLIGRLTFGESFGCLEKQTMHPWVAALFNNAKAIQFLQILQQYGMEKYIMPLLLTGKAALARQTNWQWASDRIETRVEKGSHNGDFWDQVLERSDEQEGKGMTVEEMKVTAGNLVLAGSETTATLLAGTIFLLCKNPEAMKKVTLEIRNAFKSLDAINLHSIESLPYTLAVLNEAMRLYPPVSTQLTRLAPVGGDTIDGKFVPTGTAVFVCQYASNLNEANFTRASEFHPERFLGAEEFKNDNFSALQPFSLGPRNCIGKNLAYAEMRMILAKVLWKFDYELDPRSKDWTANQKTYVLWEKDSLWVNVKSVA